MDSVDGRGKIRKIPTSNSEKTLRHCLESVQRETYPASEIIVVDDFSVDRTKCIALMFGTKFIRRRVGRADARNLGFQYSSGEYILFLDSDQQLNQEPEDGRSMIANEISHDRMPLIGNLAARLVV